MRIWLCLLLSLAAAARQPHPSDFPILEREHDNWIFEVTVQPEVPPPPDRFDFMRVEGRPCHIARERLPWRVHVGDPGYGPILDRAISIWNRTGLDLGLGYLFLRCDDPGDSDLHLRWYDPQLPRDKAAATWWSEGGSGRRVLGISLDGGFPVPEGNRVQILAHELGHVLGLGESYQMGDMMFYQMDHRRLWPDQVELSLRDKLALRWLYQQRIFAPIRGRRD